MPPSQDLYVPEPDVAFAAISASFRALAGDCRAILRRSDLTDAQRQHVDRLRIDLQEGTLPYDGVLVMARRRYRGDNADGSNEYF